jgi:hypothetical protein
MGWDGACGRVLVRDWPRQDRIPMRAMHFLGRCGMAIAHAGSTHLHMQRRGGVRHGLTGIIAEAFSEHMGRRNGAC